ncbi:M48 family metallopeptidase [Arcobacter roscoffensis]|uniref:M48 family metallopeptidase n=1 Tax=Arcobacter roscoffensis TaxID=2961520 RepID=A0ABY5E7P2_9BACT|nr:M48 family metallopeptidase [Arcobacter roscoffensis]UTJ07677.1 M48 family metallopeptidase [Arcobacter roscoffensis]
MKFLKNLIFITLLSLIILGCTQKTPYTNRSQMIFMSPKEELALGEKSYKQALSKSEVLTNTTDARRVQNIGLKIAQVAKRPDFKWEFNLVKNKAKNAFCLPGGKVVVYTGILEVAQNDDQLATVMAHEVAHALARHGAERMSSAMVQQGLQVIGNVVLASTAPEYTNVFNQAYGVGSQLGVMLPYGRLQESEADEIGIYLMAKANYDIHEALNFWKNMSKGKKQTNEFFSTHPSSSTRIANIQRVIEKIESTQTKVRNQKTESKSSSKLLGNPVY